MVEQQLGAIKFSIHRHSELIEGKGVQTPLLEPFVFKRRNQYMILYSGVDSSIHYVDNKRVMIPAKSALFLGPDRLTHFHDDAQAELHVIQFTDLFYNRNSKDAQLLLNSPLFHHFAALYMTSSSDERIPYIEELINLMYICQEQIEKGIFNELAHNSLKHIILLGSLHHNRSVTVSFEESVDSRLLLEFKELLDKHYVNEKTVLFYTEKLNITDKRLTQASKNLLNCSPKELITKKIMDEAKWQLLYTSKSIKEIAGDLGYFDEQNFSAFFLKNEGIRPKNFVAKHRQNEVSDFNTI